MAVESAGTVDALVITGPVNQRQLGVEGVSWRRRTVIVDVQPPSGITSTQYAAAMTAFLASGGGSLRKAILRRVQPRDASVKALGRVTVVWFSAGHGAVQKIFDAGSASDVDLYLCLDGLYSGFGPRKFAVTMARGAVEGKWGCIATASNTGPPEYANGMQAWGYVLKEVAVKEGGVMPPGFPAADQVYRRGKLCVGFFPEIGHHGQTPAMREGMMQAARDGFGGGVGAVLDRLTSSPAGKVLVAGMVVGAAWLLTRIAR